MGNALLKKIAFILIVLDILKRKGNNRRKLAYD